MIRFYFGKNGKLVRDKVAELTLSQKHGVKTRAVGDKSLAEAIVKKMPEEISELSTELREGRADGEKEELADVLTLIYSYLKARGFEMAEIDQLIRKKSDKRGAFDKGVIIEYIDLSPNGDDYEFWLKHFRSQPNQYIEEDLDA
jgi:predicted house-cleaning noncanonical NTP pyrophosphatase (MazG superfamily)